MGRSGPPRLWPITGHRPGGFLTDLKRRDRSTGEPASFCPRGSTFRGRGRGFRGRGGFTWVDAVVGVAVVGIGLCCLLPVLGQGKDEAQSAACQNNLSKISVAAHAYANDFGGRFFYSSEKYAFMPLHGPENEPDDYQNGAWYDEARIGQYLEGEYQLLNLERGQMPDGRKWRWDYGIGGGVLTCPAESNSPRAYHMNGWASGSEKPGTRVEIKAQPRFGIEAEPEAGGDFFDSTVQEADKVFLFAEVHPNLQTERGFATHGWMTLAMLTPSERAGIGKAVVWPAAIDRNELTAGWHSSPFDYERHGEVQILMVNGSTIRQPPPSSVGEIQDVLWSPRNE